MPTWIADVLYAWRQGRVSADLAAQAATLCVDCGACQHFCHEGQPLPAAIREARADLGLAPARPPLPGRVEGSGARVAVLSDDRDWAPALASRLGEAVASVRAPQGLGEPAGGERAVALRALFAGRRAVVADGAVASALAAAQVPFDWLHDLLGWSDLRPGCAQAGGAAGCCGGAGPLSAHHPTDAGRMASRWAAGGVALADSRCARHVATSASGVEDAVGRLLDGVGGVA